jgi:hypothetical protein
VQRARVTISNGDRPSASVAGMTDFTFEPYTGPDGSPTVTRNAMFGFAPEFRIGKSSGRSEAFGLAFEAEYGETADYEFSSEMAGEVHPRA